MSSDIGWSFLRSRRWLGYYALLAIFSIACALLGNWQFDRRAEARAEIARIDSNYDASPIQLREAVPDRQSFDLDAHKWQPVELHGEYFGDTYLARNRPGEGGVGSALINGFRLDDGTVLFVDRGWVPVLGTDDQSVALPEPPAGEATVIVRLRAGEPEIAGRETSGLSIASINPIELASLAGVTDVSYTAAYGQLVSEVPSAPTGVLAEKPERDEGPHLSYALQWYVFILIALFGVAYAARQEHRGLNAGSEAVRKQDERRAARKRRKGPSDADEEDALLEA